MATEDVDPRFADLDAWSLASAMEAMWEGQLAAVAAVGRALSAVTAATNAAYEALGDRGRLIYVGAGTSGRVAVQDGAELTPTFAWPQERLRFIIAGGQSAFAASVEGAEDDVADAARQIDAVRLSPLDVVIAVSASGTTPFTVAALQHAGRYGVVTIGVANNPGTALLTSAKYPVLVETGRELLAGSTRMKAGTAQKVVLNLISTGIMLRLGRVYRGMMVNMQMTNAKLKRRALGLPAAAKRRLLVPSSRPMGISRWPHLWCWATTGRKPRTFLRAIRVISVACSLISLAAVASEVEHWLCSKDGG